MAGSIIIHEPNADRLAELDIENLDDFQVLELDELMTIDFESALADSESSWAEGEPIQYDPESGMALFKVAEEGLSDVLANDNWFDDDQSEDVEKLKAFISANGTANIYELATF